MRKVTKFKQSGLASNSSVSGNTRMEGPSHVLTKAQLISHFSVDFPQNFWLITYKDPWSYLLRSKFPNKNITQNTNKPFNPKGSRQEKDPPP